MARAPLRSRRIANILKFGITRELIPLLRAQVLLRGLSLQVIDFAHQTHRVHPWDERALLL